MVGGVQWRFPDSDKPHPGAVPPHKWREGLPPGGCRQSGRAASSMENVTFRRRNRLKKHFVITSNILWARETLMRTWALTLRSI
jgi:hypothetical protein